VLVALDGDALGDVVGPDRERHQVGLDLDGLIELTGEDVRRGRAADAEIHDPRIGIQLAQAAQQAADVVPVLARGPHAFDRAVAEGDVHDGRAAVRRQAARIAHARASDDDQRNQPRQSTS